MPRFSGRYSFTGLTAIFAISLISFSGCLEEKSAQLTTDPPNDTTTSVKDELVSLETNSVAVVSTMEVSSPAKVTAQEITAKSTPSEVCQRFLDLLQSGNRIAAENLLTRTALTATTKAGLKLEAMGGPTSTYRTGEVRYATNKQKLAHVDTYVIDNVDGEPYEMEVTWQLHKHLDGWRISGLMLELEPGQTKDLLSLENQFDVAKLQSLAGVEALEETESRQAKVSDNNQSSQLK
jgi:hypothetical protein